jgi:hypothetical protein
MKKFLITILCSTVVLPVVASAQVKQRSEPKPKEPATKLEEFAGRKGRLIVKDSSEIGEIAGLYRAKIAFRALVVYEPGQEAQRSRGLVIKVTEEGEYPSSSTSFLDLEEIASLSKAIDYMTELSTKWKDVHREYTEVVFSTKDDFRIGFWKKGTETEAFSSSGYIGKVTCFLRTMQDLGSVKTLVDKGLQLLNEK